MAGRTGRDSKKKKKPNKQGTLNKGTLRTGRYTAKGYAAEQGKKANKKPPNKPAKNPTPKKKPATEKKPALRANPAHRVSASGAARAAGTAGRQFLGKGHLGTAAGLLLLGASGLHGLVTNSDTSKNKTNSKTNKLRGSSTQKQPKKNVSNRPKPTPKPKPNKKPVSAAKRKSVIIGGAGADLSSPHSYTSVTRLKKKKKRNPTELKRRSYVKTKGGDYPVYKKKSASAGSFREAFRLNRKAGKKTFKWRGRLYTTKLKKK